MAKLKTTTAFNPVLYRVAEWWLEGGGELEQEFLTISELARRSGLAESTTRRYIKTFKEFFNTRKEGQRVLYGADGLDILKRVAELYSKGLTTYQVKERLTGAYTAYHEVEDNSIVDTTRETEKSRERLTSILERLVDHKDETKRIRKELEKERETREKNEAELYRQLQELRQEKELRQEEENKKPPWYKKFFMKK